MSSNLATVSVVICAYSEERWALLEKAILSVQKQTLLPFEIILVIDHNPKMLIRAKAAFPDIIVIENTEVKGAGGSRNSGVALAKGQLVAFLDDDAIAEPDWLMHLVTAFKSENILGVGGALKPSWESRKPPWLPEEFYWVIGCDYRGLPKDTGPLRNLIAANMSMRKDVFVSVNGFRSGFGKVGTRFGCDETELCIRVSQLWPNGVWLYEPKAVAHHHVSAKRATWHYFRSRCFDEGIAKASLSRLLGSKSSLSSEKAYLIRVLPLGVARGIGDVVLQRNLSGMTRSVAIVAGLGFTVAGFLTAALSERLTRFKNFARLNRRSHSTL